jgi:hypothetical protein
MTVKSSTKTYSSWQAMRTRCQCKKHRHYKNYGGRGSKICERWQSFDNFLADMGARPEGCSLDRIDPDKNYEPGNCRWATKKEQMRNMRATRRVTIEGKTYVAADLAEQINMKVDALIKRAKRFKTYAEVMDPMRHYKKGLALGGSANGKRKQSMTHCSNGHEHNAENTHVDKNGWRQCRACARDKYYRLRERKKCLQKISGTQSPP